MQMNFCLFMNFSLTRLFSSQVRTNFNISGVIELSRVSLTPNFVKLMRLLPPAAMGFGTRNVPDKMYLGIMCISFLLEN